MSRSRPSRRHAATRATGVALTILAALAGTIGPARADFGSLDGPLEVERLAGATFAALIDGPEPELRVYDARSAVPLHAIALDPAFRYVDLEPVHLAGEPIGLALLGQRRANGGVRVWRWTAGRDRLDGSIGFGRVPEPMDLEVQDGGGAHETLMVLGHYPDSGRSRLLSRRAGPDERIASANLGAGFVGQDLELLPPYAGDPDQARAYVLGTVSATGASRVKGVALGPVRGGTVSVGLGRVDARDLLVLGDVGSGRPGIAALRAKVGERFVRIDLRTLDGSAERLVSVRSDAEPIELIPAGRSGEGLAVLTEHADHLGAHVTVVDPADDAVLSRTGFGSGARSHGAAELLVDGVRGFALAEIPTTDPHARVKVRTVDGRRVRTLPTNRAERLPGWFESARVQGHTRLPIVHPRYGLERSFHRTELSEAAAGRFAELGAVAFTRNAKAADEDPWWPSEAPSAAGLASRYAEARDNEGIALERDEDLVQRYVDDGWASGLPVNLYYADSGETTLARERPEWVCRTVDGEPIGHATKGLFLDITGDYGDVVATRLLELADRGAAGIYLDFRHMPVNGCWGTALAEGYEALTGEPAPPRGNTAAYRRFVAHFATRVAQTIDGWRATLAAEYPHVAMIVSVTSVPGLTRPDMSSRLAGVANPKSEFRLAVRRGQNNSVFTNDPTLHEPAEHVRMALGWSLLRDVARGNLAHVWNSSTPNRDHLLAFVSAVTGHGLVAALDVAEELLASDGEVPGLSSREDLRAGFELGAAVSSRLSGTAPVRWAGVHFSESARDAFGLDSAGAWRALLLATVGGYEALSRSGLPVKVLTDETLLDGGLDDIDVLLVPAASTLEPALESAIDGFAGRGGTVLRNAPDARWDDAAAYEARVAALRDAVDTLGAPVRVSGLPDGAHAVAFERPGALTVAVTNRFDFVQSFNAPTASPDTPVNPTPAPVPAGVEVFVSDGAVAGLDLARTDLRVYDALTGEALSRTREADGLRVTLGDFDRLVLVAVE